MNRILTKTRLLTATLLFGALPLLPFAPDLRAQSASSAAAKEIHVAATADKISIEATYVVPKKDIAELKKLLSPLSSKASSLTSARKQWSISAQSARKREKDPPPSDRVDKAQTDFDAVNQKVTDFLTKGSYPSLEIAGGAAAPAPAPVATPAPKGGKADKAAPAPAAGKDAGKGKGAKEPAPAKESAEPAKASGDNSVPQDSYLCYTWSKTVDVKSSTRTETTKTDGIAVVRVAPKLLLRGTGEPAVSWLVEYEVTEVEKAAKPAAGKDKGKDNKDKGRRGR